MGRDEDRLSYGWQSCRILLEAPSRRRRRRWTTFWRITYFFIIIIIIVSIITLLIAYNYYTSLISISTYVIVSKKSIVYTLSLRISFGFFIITVTYHPHPSSIPTPLNIYFITHIEHCIRDWVIILPERTIRNSRGPGGVVHWFFVCFAILRMMMELTIYRLPVPTNTEGQGIERSVPHLGYNKMTIIFKNTLHNFLFVYFISDQFLG